MGRSVLSLIGLATALLAAPAAAAESDHPDRDVERFAASPLGASGPWKLIRSGDGCTLKRDFTGREFDSVTLTVQRMLPGGWVHMGLFGDDIETSQVKPEIGFIPDGGLVEYQNYMAATVGDRPGFVIVGPAYPVAFVESGETQGRSAEERIAQYERSTTHFVVSGVTPKPIALATGAMEKPFEAIERCLAEKLAKLGITPEIQERTAQPVKPVDQMNWARKLQQAYPADALQQRREGSVPVRLVIDESGRVKDCLVTVQSVARSLREAACNGLVEHARFAAARGADGKALPSVYTTVVTYKLTPGMEVDSSGMLVRE